MATTEELLATAESDTEVEETTPDYFEIDSDLRTITIPSSKKILGVESDEEVNRLYFRMPATYEGTDLSDFKIRINYLNANKDGDAYVVTDSESDGDYITFSWIPGRNATAYKGNVTFIVCLKLVDSESAEVTKEFNTTVATVSVLEGLETTEAIAQENPDLMEQILLQIEACEEATSNANTAASDANTAATNANAATENANTAIDAIYTDKNFLLLLKDDGTVSLTYDDGNGDVNESDLPTDTTLVNIGAILDSINDILSKLASTGINAATINGIDIKLDDSGRVVFSYTDDSGESNMAVLPTETTGQKIISTLEEMNDVLFEMASNTEEQDGN